MTENGERGNERREWLHRAYGLTIVSNRRIDAFTELSRERDGLRPDLSIEFQRGPHLTELLRTPSHVRYARAIEDAASPHLIVRVCDRGRLYNVHYGEGIDFTFDSDARRVWIRWDREADPEHVQTYLLGPIMGLLLRVRNVVCLHASAVKLDGRAVAFVGSAFAGKSTTAMALARRGYPILSDDIVPLHRTSGQFSAGSAYPRVQLRTSALAALCAMRSDRPDLPIPEGEPGRIRLALGGGYEFQPEPVPLGRIYVLSARECHDRAPRIAEMSRLEGMMALVTNSYGTRLLDRAMRREEMEWFADVCERVPIFRLISHTDGDRLEQLCDLIIREGGRHTDEWALAS